MAKVSHQRAWQARKVTAGRCRQCGRPAVVGLTYCPGCREKNASKLARHRHAPLPDGAWEEAREWFAAATADVTRIASYSLKITYVGGGSTEIKNSPRTRLRAVTREGK